MYDDLSVLARALGTHLAQNCENGMPEMFSDTEIEKAFPDSGIRDLGDAAAELEAAGLVVLSTALGRKLPIIRPTTELFNATDPGLFGTVPIDDAVELARMLIRDETLGHVPKLEKATGWPRRRFNPALALLKPLFDPGKIRRVIQNDYPTLGMIIDSQARIRLRSFIETNG